MSSLQYLVKQKDSAQFDSLLKNHLDESAWYSIFGERLRTEVCTVVIREAWIEVISRGGRSTFYRREALGYC